MKLTRNFMCSKKKKTKKTRCIFKMSLTMWKLGFYVCGCTLICEI